MKKTLILLSSLFAFLAGPALAQDTGSSTGQTVRDIVFSEVEKRVIRDYFGKGATAAKEDDEEKEEDDKDGDRDDDDDDKDRSKKWKDKDRKKDKKHKGKGKNKGMPPGLAKKNELPPGLKNRLEKHGSLPPGLAKRDLPDNLEDQLPEEEDGTERQVVGNDVVLIEKGTGMVLDILRDVITKGQK